VVRNVVTAFALVALGLSRDPGCGDGSDQKRGANGPCTRNDDCGSALLCLEGVCRDPDAGTPDASAGVGAGDGGADGG
jgi:hypothetical protein